MDYFRILNLKKGPFSNSPDPELFYPSRNHVDCLHRIEMAIRLRRGLNVVLGEVGTGKTTLCRKLIQQISSTTDDSLELHLVLDPSFSVPHEFLSFIANCFGINTTEVPMTEWQLKEAIKKYIFLKGVEQGKNIVLLIDEGQKLPDFCLEILREFLNYETNDSKLIQILIFAQKEFMDTINARPNFANRINLCHTLLPLGFRETCKMVEFRLRQSSESGSRPNLFSWAGLIALYRETGGYPRPINMLCHHVMLSLIIQNRTKAGWSIVRSSAGRLNLGHLKPVTARPRIATFAATTAVLLLLFAALTYNSSFSKRPLSESVPVQNIATATSAREKLVTNEKKLPPEVFGELSVTRGTSLWQVFHEIYGSTDTAFFSKFTKMNPNIKNINILQTGETVVIPAVPATGESVTKRVWVQVARMDKLSEAYEFLRSYSGNNNSLMIFPFWNQHDGLVFAVMLKESFTKKEDASESMKQLSSPAYRDKKILDAWDGDTVFYRRLGDKS